MIVHALYSARNRSVSACVSRPLRRLTHAHFGTSDLDRSESLRALGRLLRKLLAGLALLAGASPRLQRHPAGGSWALRGLRPALRAPLRGRARSFLMSPSRAGRHRRPAPTDPRSGSAWPRSRTPFETRVPAPLTGAERGLRPQRAFARLVALRAPACRSKLVGSPTSGPLDQGLCPHTHGSRPPVACAPGSRPGPCVRLPRLRPQVCPGRLLHVLAQHHEQKRPGR